MSNNERKDIPLFPTFLNIETVNACNAKCVFCTIKQWPRKTAMMNEYIFEEILHEATEHRNYVEQVCLTGAGEPLLDKRISERVDRMKKAGIKKVNLITNASLLSENMSKSLLEAGLDELLFSINGLNKKKYEKLRVGLNFDTVMTNTKRFVDLRNKINPDTSIRMRMEAHPIFTDSEIQEWIIFWKNLLGPQDDVYAKKMHNWGNQLDQYDNKKREINHPCKVLWSTMSIHSDGQVGLCCIDFKPKFKQGNIYTTSIKEIWKGSKFEKIRSLHTIGKRKTIALCKDCVIWEDDQKIR